MKIINIDRLKKSIKDKQQSLLKNKHLSSDKEYYIYEGLGIALNLIDIHIIEISSSGLKQIKKMSKHNNIAIFMEKKNEDIQI